jgi:hypothetical protein
MISSFFCLMCKAFICLLLFGTYVLLLSSTVVLLLSGSILLLLLLRMLPSAFMLLELFLMMSKPIWVTLVSQVFIL